jgi:hypothetical protein
MQSPISPPDMSYVSSPEARKDYLCSNRGRGGVVVGGGGKFIQGTAMSEVDAGRDRSTPAAVVAL